MAVINRMANLDMKLAPLDAKGRARKPRKKGRPGMSREQSAKIDRMGAVTLGRCSGKSCPPGPCQKGKTPRKKRKTRGQVVVEIWLRQRGLRWGPLRGKDPLGLRGRDPLPADYKELARRIDSFRERVLKGAT